MDYYMFVIAGMVGGILGGALYCFVQKIGWNDNYEWARRIFFGAVAGLILFVTGDYALNTIVGTTVESWFAVLVVMISPGYMGIDIVTAFINKYRKTTPPQ